MNEELKCEAVEPQLTALALGELSTGAAEQIEAHLASCAACRAASEDIAAALVVVRSALAAKEAPARLDRRHDPRRAPVAKSSWRAVARDWLNLPASGPIEHSLWPGAFARAALILIIPISVGLGLLIPGVRMAWHLASINEPASAARSAGPQGDAHQDYTVEIRPAIELADRDRLTTNEASIAATPAPEAPSNSAFAAAAEHWNGESIVNNALPDGHKLGLGMHPEKQAGDLAHATAALIAAGLEKGHTGAQQAAIAKTAPLHKRDTRDGKYHLISTAAAPPPPMTNAAIVTNNVPPPAVK